MVEGWEEVQKHRGSPWLMIISVAVTFFLMPVAVLFPLMTVTHFGGDTFQMSLVEIVWGAGTLLGGLILGVWKLKDPAGWADQYSSYSWPLGSYILISGLLPSDAFVLFVCLTIIGGLAGSFYSGPFTSVLQTFIDRYCFRQGIFTFWKSEFITFYDRYFVDRVISPIR